MQLTRQELESKLAEAEANLVETKANLAATQDLLRTAIQRISALEEQINKNSKNSSKPPSTDRKPNSSKDGKARKGRNNGVNRNPIPSEQVDAFIISSLDTCPSCGSSELTNLG